jgi:hypothetical protein
MKKKSVTKVDAIAETMSGSPSAIGAGVDVTALYIDMLCERFKNRGIKTSAQTDTERQRARDAARYKQLGIRMGKEGVCATDAKYKSLNINGRSYMSSDDFAAYYKDLRDYKLPRFYSRSQREYDDAEAAAMAEKNVQESGKPPKKAKWLAITKHAKDKVKEIPSHINREEFQEFADEWFLVDKEKEIKEGKKTKMPAGVISTLAIVTLSLLLIVCSSVMVSRASSSVSLLEDKIDSLSFEIRDLEGKLEVKNNMLNIKEIAVSQYGMISGDYASARYVDLREDEKIEKHDKPSGDSWLGELLRAIGFESK